VSLVFPSFLFVLPGCRFRELRFHSMIVESPKERERERERM
jgi:hypothetical protein